MEPDPTLDDRRVSFVTGIVALVASSLVGMFLSVATDRWPDLLAAVVPAALSVAAVLTGPSRSAGRKLGWIAMVVIAAGVVAATIYNVTTDPSTLD